MTNNIGVIHMPKKCDNGYSFGGMTNNIGIIPLFVIPVRPDSVSRNANYVRFVMEMFDCRLRLSHSVPTKSSTERGKHI